jgi:hypothetical protein
MPYSEIDRVSIALAITMLASGAVFAQEADEASKSESDEIEEIVVVAPKDGDRKRVDKEYEDPVRSRLLKELYKMKQIEEEYEWRKSAASENPSRMKWGYDPRDEYRMRNEINLKDFPSDGVKPATLFRYDY